MRCLSKRLFVVTVLSWVFTSACTLASISHPNHVSLAEIEFNSKTGNFEVALSVHPEDLEKTLVALHANDAKATEDFVFNEQTIDRYAKDWLSSQFVMRKIQGDQVVDSQSLPIRWVGCEPELKKVWLFFEVQVKTDLQSIELENKLFLSINDDQTNHVRFKHGRELKWFKTNVKSTKVSLKLANSASKN